MSGFSLHLSSSHMTKVELLSLFAEKQVVCVVGDMMLVWKRLHVLVHGPSHRQSQESLVPGFYVIAGFNRPTKPHGDKLTSDELT